MKNSPRTDKRRTKFDEQRKETIRRIETCLRDGYAPPWASSSSIPGAVTEAAIRAVADGFDASSATFRDRFYRASREGFEPDWSLWKAPVYQKAESLPRSQQQIVISEAHRPAGKPLKICVIGDAHDDPRLEDKSRFRWMGQWCRDERPDVIIQIGDWATFDSMSSHHQKGSLDHILMPSWTQDVESLWLSISAFEAGLSGYKPKRKILTEGNHESRAARYENSNPEISGALTAQWREAFRSNGWRIVDFGVYHFEEGVGFIHHPVNGAGRAYGGKTGNQRAGNDSVFTVVHGHDHKWELATSPKIGPSKPVEMVSVGCSLPWGHVESYAKIAATGWWWGVTSMTVLDGGIIDLQKVSMLTLEDRYGEKKRPRPKPGP